MMAVSMDLWGGMYLGVCLRGARLGTPLEMQLCFLVGKWIQCADQRSVAGPLVSSCRFSGWITFHTVLGWGFICESGERGAGLCLGRWRTLADRCRAGALGYPQLLLNLPICFSGGRGRLRAKAHTALIPNSQIQLSVRQNSELQSKAAASTALAPTNATPSLAVTL